ncbi:MAG: sarcosine oxidase subunit gamma family protein [Paracoccaceae bacterium]|jgi:sarcosine oxidase subunit gamma|nr:sarcosine oxidase subunit gamma family protein [Paracoccaceae bacterium]MDP7184112.1 sarcosine oxidase subunit gamma family protein [Paracoccaceae bacterium]
MSNAVSALSGAEFQGIAHVKEQGLIGMITLRGDFASDAFKAAAEAVSGCALPEVRKITVADNGNRLAWMSPDEMLLVCDHGAAPQAVADLTERLGGEHSMVVNVSDARAVFRIEGEKCREVVAKVAPVDMADFGVDDFRRTRFAQVPAAFWMSGAESVDVVCFRSVAQYMFDLLSVAAQEGSEVGVY